MDETLKFLNMAVPGYYSNALPVKGCMMTVLYGLLSVNSILGKGIFFYIRFECIGLPLYHYNSAVPWHTC